MTEHVSPLRQRMIDDMAIRNMSPNTQNPVSLRFFFKKERMDPPCQIQVT
jgi:hypothetical protein